MAIGCTSTPPPPIIMVMRKVALVHLNELTSVSAGVYTASLIGVGQLVWDHLESLTYVLTNYHRNFGHKKECLWPLGNISAILNFGILAPLLDGHENRLWEHLESIIRISISNLPLFWLRSIRYHLSEIISSLRKPIARVYCKDTQKDKHVY